MDIKWILIVLIIAVIILANVLFVHKNYYKQKPKIREHVNLEKAYPLMKTGDILLFRSKYRSVPLPYLFGDEFSHSGLIFVDPIDGQKYVFEASDIQQFENLGFKRMREGVPGAEGVKLTPLYTRLRHYDGSIVWRPLNKPLDEHRLKLFEEAMNELLTKKFINVYSTQPAVEYITNCILLIPATERQLKSLHCAQAIVVILEKARIMEFLKSDICARPQCFAGKFLNFKSIDGYKYSYTDYEIIPPH